MSAWQENKGSTKVILDAAWLALSQTLLSTVMGVHNYSIAHRQMHKPVPLRSYWGRFSTKVINTTYKKIACRILFECFCPFSYWKFNKSVPILSRRHTQTASCSLSLQAFCPNLRHWLVKRWLQQWYYTLCHISQTLSGLISTYIQEIMH